MNHLTTDLIEALAQKQDIEEVFRHHLETAINQLLKHELTVFLDYEPYDREGFHSGNSRNGYYDRTFKTEYGELHLRILFLIGTFFINKYVPNLQLDLELALFLAIWLFIGYVFLRYIISGMEYTDISTEQAYKRQLKVILTKSCGFVIIFNLLYLIFILPNSTSEWFESIAISVIGGFILFSLDYISLKKSYKKNKDLL